MTIEQDVIQDPVTEGKHHHPDLHKLHYMHTRYTTSCMARNIWAGRNFLLKLYSTIKSYTFFVRKYVHPNATFSGSKACFVHAVS